MPAFAPLDSPVLLASSLVEDIGVAVPDVEALAKVAELAVDVPVLTSTCELTLPPAAVALLTLLVVLVPEIVVCALVPVAALAEDVCFLPFVVAEAFPVVVDVWEVAVVIPKCELSDLMTEEGGPLEA